MTRSHKFIHPPDLNWPSLSSAVRAPKLSPLLTIPSAIRARIFSLLLVSDEDIVVGPYSQLDFCKYAFATKEGDPDWFQMWHSELLQPLLVCRQLFSELMPMFYSLNTFEIAGPVYHEYLVKFLKGIGERRRRYIGGIIVSDADGEGHESIGTAKLGFKLLGESCRLKKLHLAVREEGLRRLTNATRIWDEKAGHWINNRELDVRKYVSGGEDIANGKSTIHYLEGLGGLNRLIVDKERCPDTENLELKHCRMYELRGMRDLTREMPGIQCLKALRGLTEVSIRSLGRRRSIGEANQRFGEDLVKLLTTPKALVEGEDEAEVPAMRSLKEFHAKKRALKSVTGVPRKVQMGLTGKTRVLAAKRKHGNKEDDEPDEALTPRKVSRHDGQTKKKRESLEERSVNT